MRQPAPFEEPLQPRTIDQPCSQCGQVRQVLNGEHFRRLRLLSKLTLTEMARVCGGKVGVTHLSMMERGRSPFRPEYAAMYDRLLERRRRSGQDW